MEDIINNVLAQYGAIGLLIVGLIYIVKQLLNRLDERDKAHKEERMTLHETHKQLTERVIESSEKNTQVLAELKTIIKSNN